MAAGAPATTARKRTSRRISASRDDSEEEDVEAHFRKNRDDSEDDDSEEEDVEAHLRKA